MKLFTRILKPLFIVLAFSGSAIAAVDIPYVNLWQLPSGTVDENCIPINLTELFNRNYNAVRRTPYWRAPIVINPAGFDPNSGNVLLGCGWTYETAFQVAEDHAWKVIAMFGAHCNGAPNGPGYHRCQPIMDPLIVDNTVAEFMQWAALAHPGVEIVGWQYCNECEYAPAGGYSHAKWFAVFEKIKTRFPASAWRFSAGNSGFETRQQALSNPITLEREAEMLGISLSGISERDLRTSVLATMGVSASAPTLNGWLASTGKARANRIILDVHGNGLSRGNFFAELRYLPDRFPGATTASLEDRPPYSVGHNDAKDRAETCAAAQALACSVFFGRDSGNPPLSSCSWGTNPPLPPRWDIGVEGCERCWQDGSRCNGRSTPDNWRKVTRASRFLGQFVPGDDLPNHVSETPPPPPPPPPPADTYPGENKFIAMLQAYSNGNEMRARRFYQDWYDKVFPPSVSVLLLEDVF